MKHPVFALLLVLTFAPGLVAAADSMRPGMWEVSTRVAMTGMPMEMPPHVARRCYTQQDIDNGTRTAPGADDKECKITNYRRSGNTATWNIACTGEDAMIGTGSLTMTATSFTGKSKFKIKDGAATIDGTHQWSGKRIGDCR